MGTTVARWAALAIAAGLVLAGCGSVSKPKTAGPGAEVAPGGGRDTAPATPGLPAQPPSPAVRPPECNEPSVHPQVWFTVCGETRPAPGEPAPLPSGPLPLGQAVTTSGDTNYGASGGTLEVTPTTAVYLSGKDTGTVADKGGYITVTVKEHNKGATPAEPADGTSGAGFEYIAPDGEALGVGVLLVPSGFVGMAKPVAPGTFVWAAQTWEIRNDQRGGTLKYTDGTGVTYAWKIPTQDSGPQVEQVRNGF